MDENYSIILDICGMLWYKSISSYAVYTKYPELVKKMADTKQRRVLRDAKKKEMQK